MGDGNGQGWALLYYRIAWEKNRVSLAASSGKLGHNCMIYLMLFSSLSDTARTSLTFITGKNAKIDVIHTYRENKTIFRNP